VGIEIYDGIIQPGESTNWWARHRFITRSPLSVINGALSPSLLWQPEKSGYYTVVMVLREYWKEDPRMELMVSTIILNNATVITQIAETGNNAHK